MQYEYSKEILANEALYWFCVRHNDDYRSDVDTFGSYFSDVIEVFGQPSIKMRQMLGTAHVGKDKYVLSSEFTEMPMATPQCPVPHSNKEEIDLLNASYFAFLFKWRIEPTKYQNVGVFVPRIFVSPKPSPSTTVIDVPGYVEIKLSASQSKEERESKFREAMNGINLGDSQNVSKRDLQSIRNTMQLFLNWRRANPEFQNKSLFQIECLREDSKKTNWPEDVKEDFKKLFSYKDASETNLYPNLNKELNKALLYIQNPEIVFRAIASAKD